MSLDQVRGGGVCDVRPKSVHAPYPIIRSSVIQSGPEIRFRYSNPVSRFLKNNRPDIQPDRLFSVGYCVPHHLRVRKLFLLGILELITALELCTSVQRKYWYVVF